MNKTHVLIALAVGVSVGYFFADKLAAKSPYRQVLGALPS